MEDIGAALGSSPPAGTLQVTVFIPSVDREERPIAQEAWTDECLAVLGRLFRGGTAFPPGRGVWRDDEAGGRLVYDETVLVTSYVAPDSLTDEALASLRAFLHRLGRVGRQGEVAWSLAAAITASKSMMDHKIGGLDEPPEDSFSR